jgi:hypothetical protein
MSKESVWQGVKEMGRAKMKRRRKLASLPFEKKIPVLLRLQRIAREIGVVSGRKCPEVWKCSE